MTGAVLSPDAIEALVEAAKEGRLPEEQAQQPRRQRRVRTVDFTRPTKFTSDQERRIQRSLDAFCRTASTRLSAELRVPLELEAINVSQLTWSNAHAQVPTPSVSAVLETRPHDTRLLLSVESGLVLAAIELLLGGTEIDDIRERRLTDIDTVLARHFMDRLANQLSIIWSDVADLELGVAGIDAHLETAQLALVSEPTLSLTIEARLAGTSSTMTLLVPYQSIAPVAHRFSTDVHAGDGAGTDGAVRRAVGGVNMTVRAEVGAIELPVEQVLALQPGDVLRLGPTAGGITLFAGDVPVQQARAGRSGSRRAVQVLGPPRSEA
jgi:flagellar motor switch protein FliM